MMIVLSGNYNMRGKKRILIKIATEAQLMLLSPLGAPWNFTLTEDASRDGSFRRSLECRALQMIRFILVADKKRGKHKIHDDGCERGNLTGEDEGFSLKWSLCYPIFS